MDDNSENKYRNHRGHRVVDINNTITGEKPKKGKKDHGKDVIKVFKFFVKFFVVVAIISGLVAGGIYASKNFEFDFSFKFPGKSSKKTETKVEEKQTTTKIEGKEVNLDKYRYLHTLFITKNLFYIDEYEKGSLVDSNITFKSLSNSYFLTLVLEKLEFEDNKFVKNDYYCRYASKNNKCPTGRIKKSYVDDMIKKLFGDIKYKHQSTKKYTYKDDYYYTYGDEPKLAFDNSEGEAVSIPYKASKKGDNIYIYAVVGVVDFSEKNRIRLYSSLDKNREISAAITIGRYESSFSGDWFYDNESLDYFMYTNRNKFSQYRYTFKKVDKNYRFVDIKRIRS